MTNANPITPGCDTIESSPGTFYIKSAHDAKMRIAQLEADCRELQEQREIVGARLEVADAEITRLGVALVAAQGVPVAMGQDAWDAMRDEILHGIDGLDNDQTNAVLGVIDNHAPTAQSAPVPPAVAMSEWLPIDTAPTAGRDLILLLTPSKFPQVAYSNSWWTCGFSVENKPSHWMPIPKERK